MCEQKDMKRASIKSHLEQPGEVTRDDLHGLSKQLDTLHHARLLCSSCHAQPSHTGATGCTGCRLALPKLAKGPSVQPSHHTHAPRQQPAIQLRPHGTWCRVVSRLARGWQHEGLGSCRHEALKEEEEEEEGAVNAKTTRQRDWGTLSRTLMSGVSRWETTSRSLSSRTWTRFLAAMSLGEGTRSARA